MVGNLTEHLTHWVEQTGTWGAGLYILVYLVTTLALLPTTPLNLTAGLLFGPGWGLLWSVVGAMLAAVVGFALARGVGQGWVKRRLGRHWGRLQKHLHRRGGWVLFWVRLLPIFPYGLVNYGAGLVGISWRDYLLTLVPGTVVGVAPVVWLGSGLQTGGSGWLGLGLALAGLLWWGGRAWSRR
ncbi:TVP38/TMEM64 family protein [Synechococcus sp. C9]|uniref:TVP38/TMEM64 family protein n=1 Tax=Synechococcus sp. C9 TaxID=102119 RepID=UPI001FF1AFD8|nr:TVP38/TMEM64 family protein [Synechococcus sp. C9]